jgi:NAD(P)-dependent dehydrogenase (short-subunit alcohol dehydrogenase family)
MTTRYAQAHLPTSLAGPRDSRPTALQVVEDNDLQGKLADKVVLVTGASSGIGVETVRALAATGAKIYATARDLEKGRKALADIMEGGRVKLLQLDTASFDSVRACAKEFLAAETQLNVLVNNAGIMAVPERTLTKHGQELHFQTNHLGHFLLFQLLKPTLLASSTPDFASRVVNVSSIGHRQSPIQFDDLTLSKTYSPFVGYGQSKTANIYMANEIERRYSSQGLHAWSLHPGGIDTGLQVHVDFSALKQMPEIQRIMKSTEQGAATTVLAAVDKELEGKGGKFLDDTAVSPPVVPELDSDLASPGHASWTYDEEAARKLWSVSCEIVGVEDD